MQVNLTRSILIPPLLVAAAIGARAASNSTVITTVTFMPPQPAAFAPAGPARRDAAPAHLDLYGNEITTAVSKYRIDARGALYELHAPHVEIPKLLSPKS